MNFLDRIYNNTEYQNSRWSNIACWSKDYISSLTIFDIQMFHHEKMAQLSWQQKMAFTDTQKSYMNDEQLSAIAVPLL